MTQLVVWFNTVANALGSVLLAPVAFLPGWLSLALAAVATGALALVAFKYTSNQRAIRRVRNNIKANLLALSLFKDNLTVSFEAQGRILLGALQLFLLALTPALVMIVPMTLILAQLAMWYQVRPLAVGDETVVALALSGSPGGGDLPEVILEPSIAIEPVIGPVRVPSQRTVFWSVRALRHGAHQLSFTVAGTAFVKELAIGDGFMRTSPLRPSWNWTDALLYPQEPPFTADSPVQSIVIDYPTRDSWTTGGNSWIVFWFIASMIAAFLLRLLFKVHF